MIMYESTVNRNSGRDL